MTYEEALDILCKGIAPNSIKNNECIELCKKAVSKQIPKKPISEIRNEVVDGESISTYGTFCPTCGKLIAPYTAYLEESVYHHCTCGQALSW